MSENEHKCLMDERIRILEQGQTGTKVYMKQVLEEIRELKTTLGTKQLNPIVAELLKLISNCIAIIGAIAGAAKILGK